MELENKVNEIEDRFKDIKFFSNVLIIKNPNSELISNNNDECDDYCKDTIFEDF